MRLLSFLNLVETHLGGLRPQCVGGWTRRVSFHNGSACFSHPLHGLTLTLRSCLLADGQHNLNASWHGADGAAITTRSFFSGAPDFRWERAAAAMTELMPAPALTVRGSDELPAPQRISA